MNLAASLTQLETAQLIRQLAEDEPAFVFKHALVQDTSYESLLKQERKRLHRLVADVLEHAFPDQLDQNAARLSEHFWRSEDWEKALAYGIRAGAQALRTYALREALSQYELARAALKQIAAPSPVAEYEALVGWAEAALRIRPYAEQLEQLARAEEIARGLNDKRRLVRALYRIGTVHTTQGHNLRAIPPLAECFTLANELDDERLVVIPTLFMGLATTYTNPRQAIHFFDRALELAIKYEDLNTLAVTWSAKAMTHARIGEAAKARNALDRALDLVRQLKSPSAQSDVYLFSAWAFLDLGNWQKGLEFGQLCVRTASDAANLDCMCGGYDCIGFNRLAEQNLPRAIETFHEAIRSSRFSGAEVFENLGYAGLAIAEYYSGKTGALADLEHTYAHAKELGDESQAATFAQSLGEISTSRGEWVKAEAYLLEAIDFFRRTQMAPYLLRSLETLAQVYVRQERNAEAERIRAEAERLRQDSQPVPDAA